MSFLSIAAIAVAISSNAQAQTLDPAVDICTGITLEASAVTDIVEVVAGPVTAIENALNSLLIIDIANSNIGGILDGIAAGDPISLTLINSEGDIVGPSDACIVGSDGYTLTTEKGISIGGNAITGLGSGDLASAAELDAIALGNGAETTVGATGAVAIGAGAYVETANSVAIGAGSMALRGALTDYAAYGLTGLQSSAGEFSVGAAGSLRQITNVAPGSAASDAATVGQVQGAVQALADLAVQYDSTAQTQITLGGAGGTTITNLAPGALDASSTDAVNGAQLYATNQQVDTNTTDIANLTTQVDTNTTDIANLTMQVDINTTDIANLTTQVDTNTTDIANLTTQVDINTTDIANLTTQVDVNTTDIANLTTQVDSNTTEITNLGDTLSTVSNQVDINTTAISNLSLQVGNVPVVYVNDADKTTPSATPTQTAAFVGASAGAVTVTNIAAGTLSASSSDAVNGSQLYATNQQVTANTAAIVQNTTDITEIQNNLAGSTVVAVQYSDPSNPRVSNGGTITQDVTLVGRSADLPVALHNVADATSAYDAVNLRQLQSGVDAAIAASNSYTDARIEQLGFDLQKVRKASNAGTAGALAVAGLPQVIEADTRMMAGAIGHYRGETAFALGLSGSSNDGRAVFKLNGTVDTRGSAGISTGAGFSF